MVNLWDISAGNQFDKINISFVTTRVTKSVRIIIPALLLSSVAFAADTGGPVGDVAKVTKKVANTKKQVKIFEKAAGLALIGETCRQALEKGAQQNKSGNLSLVALAIACGYFIAIMQLSLISDD